MREESYREALMTKQEEKRIEKLKKEKQRMYEMFSYEREYERYSHICGIDEVGRGPFAGPVVAAAVILPLSLIHI